MKTKMIFGALLLFSVIASSCNKDEAPGKSTFAVRMTDAPVAMEEVNIDLVEVRLNMDNDSLSWITMQTNPGVYNLLAFQIGLDTLIAQASLPIQGVVKEIRLVVGNNNTVKVNGQIHPLVIPSGQESGLKIKINKRLQTAFELVLIDFDAALSIQQESDGYKLRPVIRLK